MRNAYACLPIVLLSLLAACTPLRPGPGEAPPAAAGLPAGAREYQVDAGASDLRILVYRAGALAALGHNHVITTSDISGRVALAPVLTDSVVELQIPVASFAVDLPARRAEAGEDFAGEVDADAVAGTRGNLLGPRVLDAQQYPQISLVSRRITGQGSGFTVTAAVTVKDQVSEVQVPVQLVRDGDTLTATGEFTLAQTALGLEPFSVMLGALAVRDELELRFRVVARAGAESE